MKMIPSLLITLNYFLVTVLILLTGCGDSDSNTLLNVPTVEYSVDSNGCLTSCNAEAIINYANGNNRSKTFIWNCATLNGSPQKHRVEEFFVSFDGGQCFRHYQESVSDAICTTRSVAPETPIFAAKIYSFDVSPIIEGSLSGYEINATINNTGNTTLFDLEASYADQYYFLNQGTKWLVTFPSVTINDYHAQKSTSLPSNTFDVTVLLKMWDGTVLDSQTKTVVIP